MNDRSLGLIQGAHNHWAAQRSQMTMCGALSEYGEISNYFELYVRRCGRCSRRPIVGATMIIFILSYLGQQHQVRSWLCQFDFQTLRVISPYLVVRVISGLMPFHFSSFMSTLIFWNSLFLS